jgi:hypothetical protein
MYDQKRLQEIAALPSPVLTVYLNTASQDPSLHPVVPACLRWFTDEGEELSRTLLPRDGRRLKEQVERFERFFSYSPCRQRTTLLDFSLWDRTA